MVLQLEYLLCTRAHCEHAQVVKEILATKVGTAEVTLKMQSLVLGTNNKCVR